MSERGRSPARSGGSRTSGRVAADGGMTARADGVRRRDLVLGVHYTMMLKRRTASNIVIGGAAGCFPVLVGWAAVTGRVSIWAGVLFAVVFFWTPPHFWALAMNFRGDYAAARIPMLPVVATPAEVARKIMIYSYAMVATTLALTPYADWVYGACALALGGWFLVEAHRLRGRVAAVTTTAGDAAGTHAPAPMRLFHLSIAYLTLLFAAIAVSALLPVGRWLAAIRLRRPGHTLQNTGNYRPADPVQNRASRSHANVIALTVRRIGAVRCCGGALWAWVVRAVVRADGA